MSEMYEAVVAFESTPTIPTLSVSAGGFSKHVIGNRVSVYIRNADRSALFDPEIVEGAAAALSLDVLSTVAVFYDNRVGHRSASVFREGKKISSFGPGDEIWVGLDELGEPLVQGSQYRASELDPEAEYECLFDAIDLALQSAGAPTEISSRKLKQVAYSKRQAL